LIFLFFSGVAQLQILKSLLRGDYLASQVADRPIAEARDPLSRLLAFGQPALIPRPPCGV
jgi:hypothetical protein